MKKLYSENEQFFNRINTEAKAYVLGFFFADGCNHDLSNLDDGYYHQNVISFTQLEQDIDILDQIKLAMKCNRPYVEITQKTNGKKKYSLRITSNTLSNALSCLGAVPNKSLALKFPTTKQVPEKLMPHFIRGYFDGDGSVWNGKRKKMVVKSEGRTRERIVHNVKFNFTGNPEFINSLQDYLVKMLGFRKTKLNFSGKAKSRTHCTMEYSGRIQMKKLFEFMYKDATIYGSRKYNKFQEIFCASEEKSSEDTSLIAGTPEMVISSEASNVEERSSTMPEMGVESSDSKCEAPNSKEKGEDIVSSAIK